METTYTIEFMRLAEPTIPQIKQPSGFHVALLGAHKGGRCDEPFPLPPGKEQLLDGTPANGKG